VVSRSGKVVSHRKMMLLACAGGYFAFLSTRNNSPMTCTGANVLVSTSLLIRETAMSRRAASSMPSAYARISASSAIRLLERPISRTHRHASNRPHVEWAEPQDEPKVPLLPCCGPALAQGRCAPRACHGWLPHTCAPLAPPLRVERICDWRLTLKWLSPSSDVVILTTFGGQVRYA